MKQKFKIIRPYKHLGPVKNVAGKALAKQHSRLKVNIDAHDGLFRMDNLNIYEIKYLINKGYQESIQFDLNGGKDYYLLKPASNESPQHFFLIRKIVEYLREHNFEVWTYKTLKPDIIIDIQNRKIAIEIETGSNLRNNKRSFMNKLRLLRENYGYNWFFVVTNRDLVRKYKKYGCTYTRKNCIRGIWRYVNFKPKFAM